MNYEISRGTLAIVPNDDETSLVYEDENRYFIKEKPFKIMEESCKYFGSTYNGRKDSAKFILGAEYKVPIILEDSENLVLFPTTSPRSNDCAWISLRHIKKIEKVECNTTKIVFNNDKSIILPVSYRSLENQISRASRLELIMNYRKMKK